MGKTMSRVWLGQVSSALHQSLCIRLCCEDRLVQDFFTAVRALSRSPNALLKIWIFAEAARAGQLGLSSVVPPVKAQNKG